MSDQSTNDAPLFQDTDALERVYAPQQLPGGADIRADGMSDDVGLPKDGTSGVTLVPVRPDLGYAYPLMASAVANEVHDLEENAEARPTKD